MVTRIVAAAAGEAARLRGHGFEAGLELAGGGVAQGGIFFEGAQHDLVEADVDVDAARRGLELFFVGELAGEHLVEHDAKRVDVGPVVHGVGALALLGRHVARRAHDLAGLGEIGGGG